MRNFLLLFFLLLLSVTGYSQSLDGNITKSSPAICSGATVVLTANGTGGTPGYTYFWITTGENTQSISVTTARTYTVRITDQAGASKDVNISIAANPTPDAPTATNTSGPVCINSSARLEATAPSGATFNWYTDQQGGVPLFTGPVFNTPAVTTASTIYYVSAVVNECESARIGVAVSLAANPTPVGATVCANNPAVLSASGSADYRWWDAATGGTQVHAGATFPTPVLTQTTTYYVEGITSSGCVTERVPVVATVTPAPGAPTVASNPYIICINNRATLQATGPTGVLFDWYDVAEGGVSLITSPDFTTPILTANKTYWVQAKLNGCVGPRTQVDIIVNSIPLAPQATSDGAVCINSGATLRVTNPLPNLTYQWYESATSLIPLHTGEVFTTEGLSANTTFYVRAVNAPCLSDPSAVEATLLPIIEKPIVSGSTLICSSSSTELTVNQPNSNYIYEWFDSEDAVTPIYTGVTFITPVVSGNTTFYVHAKSGSCTSTRTALTITLLPLPPQPTVSPVATICYNTTATLVADNGTSYRWYTTQSGGASISSNRVFTTTALTANTTFYVSNLVDGCESDRTAITVTVNPQTSAPTVDDPGAAVCRGTPVTLHAHSSAGVLQWFSVATGGNQLFEGPDYPVSVNTTTTFYVQVANGICISDRTPVTVEVLPYISRQFQYSSGTYCLSNSAQTPDIYVLGGTFTASDGVVIDPVTGEIDIPTIGIRRFTVFYTTNNGSCDIITSAVINITAAADAEFSYVNNTFCQGGTNPRPRFTPTSSGGVFTVDHPGLVINASTGEIDLSASQPGTYIITNKVDLRPACNSEDEDTFTVTIQASVVPNAGNDHYAPKEQYTLSGSAPGANNVTWTHNGQGMLANSNTLTNAIYTPDPADNAVTFILTADDGGACGPQTSRVTITFINRPSAPITTTDTVCVGNTAILTAVSQGANTYRWYNVALDGSPIGSGANYETAPLTGIGVVSYWVEARVNDVTGPRQRVDVVVTPALGAPNVAGEIEICTGSTSLLVASAPNATTYRWFNKDMFPVWVGNTLSVPVFTNTSYFVRAETKDCVSDFKEVMLTVKQIPQVRSGISGEICSGVAQNYAIAADVTGTTFTWTRAAVAAVNNNQPGSGSGDIINEVLVSSSPSIQTVTYIITPLSPNGCSGTPFNYTVTVNPQPVLQSADKATVCDNTELGYSVVFNPAVTSFSWSRDAIEGISNGSVSDQASRNIREALHNTTNAPVIVKYRFTFATESGCTNSIELPVTINPSVIIDSKDFDLACANVPFTYQITSNVTGATYNWTRLATGSNPAASQNGVTSINEILVNNTSQQLDVYYLITPVFNDCKGPAFTYHVIVNPQPVQPVLNANTPVCEDNTLTLQTIAVPGATYKWTLPDGSSVERQDPVLNINNVTLANAGTYSLVVIVNGCSSIPTTKDIVVNRKPTADAGPPQNLCPDVTEVVLTGNASGGAGISGIWTTSGTGVFSAINDLNGKYFPSAEDKINGAVTLTLTTASPDDCTSAIDLVTFTFMQIQAANAGADREECELGFQLNGQILTANGTGTWSGGQGTFDDGTRLNAMYTPSQGEREAGSVTLTLTANGTNPCDVASDVVTITLVPPPTVQADASPIRYVAKGKTITLNPVVSDENVTYSWFPTTWLSDPTAKNPVVTVTADITYTLTVTKGQLCVSESSEVQVRVSPELTPKNTFTPNADGINDIWVIDGVEAYPKMVVDIYTRSGQPVYHSVGYAQPWDGTSNGKPVPFGVYYFVIDTKEVEQKVTGYVTVIR